jgi:hypothetical protein
MGGPRPNQQDRLHKTIRRICALRAG